MGRKKRIIIINKKLLIKSGILRIGIKKKNFRASGYYFYKNTRRWLGGLFAIKMLNENLSII